MTSGVPKNGAYKKRLPALATCKEKGWGEGVVLTSGVWNQPRKIVKISDRGVYLKSPSGQERVRSFPEDVKVDGFYE